MGAESSVLQRGFCAVCASFLRSSPSVGLDPSFWSCIVVCLLASSSGYFGRSAFCRARIVLCFSTNCFMWLDVVSVACPFGLRRRDLFRWFVFCSRRFVFLPKLFLSVACRFALCRSDLFRFSFVRFSCCFSSASCFVCLGVVSVACPSGCLRVSFRLPGPFRAGK